MSLYSGRKYHLGDKSNIYVQIVKIYYACDEYLEVSLIMAYKSSGMAIHPPQAFRLYRDKVSDWLFYEPER